jgi:uncharacterized protein
MEKLCFNNSNSRQLCGILSKAGPRMVILCHGLGSHKESPFNKNMQKKLNDKGFSTFCIDLLGHGDSHGEYDDLTLTETIDDIKCAFREMKSQGYEDIGYIGHSFGAVGGIMSAPDTDFRFMVLISPPTYFDISEMVTSGITVIRKLNEFKRTNHKRKNPTLRAAFFKDYGSHDSYKAADRIEIPALIIQGDNDDIIPMEKTLELHKHIKNSYLKILPGVDHYFADEKSKETVAMTALEWIEGRKG